MNSQLAFQNTNNFEVSILGRTPEEKNMYKKLCNKEASIAIVGLGYVGLPIALEFAKSFNVIGYDINETRVELMNQHIDPSDELDSSCFENKDIHFSSSPRSLFNADVIITAVPTPVSNNKKPDLTPLSNACKAIGKSLHKGNFVIFESTVYPGCTEEICIPILEKESGLKCNKDFWVGYSPERINPGDKVHTLTNITKIVSGSDDYAKKEIYKIYNHIITAGIHVAPNMKVAEAAKIIENTQRDVNIALMNELSIFFNALDINTHEVLEAAGTKWNFLNFYPGLVGGHCIGVDPYYLVHKANTIGMDLNIILSSRKINDSMPNSVVKQIATALLSQGKSLCKSKVLVLGSTFKEDVTDLRNSKAAEMSQILKSEVKTLHIIDPYADEKQMKEYYDLELSLNIENKYDVIIYAVSHMNFKQISWSFIEEIMSKKVVVFDFKKLLGYPQSSNSKISYITL